MEFDKIPPELMLEIFSRLPVRQLCQFRCICTQWRNLIDEPCLPRMHLSRAITAQDEEALILAYSYNRKLESSSLALMTKRYSSASPKPLLPLQFPNSGKYKLHNSCNGLLCCSKYEEDNWEEEAFVCNPITGEMSPLPPPTVKSHRPDLSLYGLGFDSCSQKYKVIRLYVVDDHLLPKHYDMGAEVYTMGATGSWRKISQPPDSLALLEGVYASGALHWRVSLDSDIHNYSVVSFDFRQEKFNTILHQREAKFPGWCWLVDLRGYVGLAHSSSDTQTEIWKLIKECEKIEWVKEYRILKLPLQEISVDGHVTVMGPIRDNEILLRIGLKDERALVAYNSKTDAVRVIDTVVHEDNIYGPQFHLLRGGNIAPLSFNH